MSTDTLNIAFCVNDRYLPYVTVCVRSIADTHASRMVRIHVLSDSLAPKSKRRMLGEFSDMPHISIEFHDVDDSSLAGLEAWSKYTWYRLLMPSVLPPDVDTVLYLDADTLVCDDLSGLFATDLSGIAVAGVTDPLEFCSETYRRCGYPAAKGYVCAGVLLINLRYWREHKLQQVMTDWAHRHHDIKFHDQDCINTVCCDTRRYLPLRYGVIDALFAEPALYTSHPVDEIEAAVTNPAIIHYAGKAPWFKDAATHFLCGRWHDCNAALIHPAPLTYKSTGMLQLKIRLHDMLHPGTTRPGVPLQQIMQYIEAARAKTAENSDI